MIKNMGRLNKRKSHMSDLQYAKRQLLLAQQSLKYYDNNYMRHIGINYLKMRKVTVNFLIWTMIFFMKLIKPLIKT